MMKPTCVSTGTLNASEGLKLPHGEFHFEFHANSVSMSWEETHLALISVKQGRKQRAAGATALTLA